MTLNIFGRYRLNNKIFLIAQYRAGKDGIYD